MIARRAAEMPRCGQFEPLKSEPTFPMLARMNSGDDMTRPASFLLQQLNEGMAIPMTRKSDRRYILRCIEEHLKGGGVTPAERRQLELLAAQARALDASN